MRNRSKKVVNLRGPNQSALISAPGGGGEVGHYRKFLTKVVARAEIPEKGCREGQNS